MFEISNAAADSVRILKLIN